MGVLLARVPYVTCLGIPRYCDQVSYNATLAGIAKTRRTPLNPGWVVAFFYGVGDCLTATMSVVVVCMLNGETRKSKKEDTPGQKDP